MCWLSWVGQLQSLDHNQVDGSYRTHLEVVKWVVQGCDWTALLSAQWGAEGCHFNALLVFIFKCLRVWRALKLLHTQCSMHAHAPCMDNLQSPSFPVVPLLMKSLPGSWREAVGPGGTAWCQDKSLNGILSILIAILLLIFLSLNLVIDDKETSWSKSGGQGVQ